MPHYRLFTLITISLLSYPLFSNETEDPAKILVQELEIRESKTPVRDLPGWRRPKKVVILLSDHRISERNDYTEWLQSAAGEAEIITIRSSGELELEREDTDVYLGSCTHIIPDMERLTWVQNYFVGVDRCASNKNC